MTVPKGEKRTCVRGHGTMVRDGKGIAERRAYWTLEKFDNGVRVTPRSTNPN